ncbi:MAG TPA: TIGR00282 family metallophosphoesterase [bacterium]|nr:TIGR00282 family metallophosphoesterase [bacterium]
MSQLTVKILFVADVIGHEGFEIMAETIPRLAKDYDFDLIVANGENAASGKGLMPRIVDDFMASGVHVITSGNHIWNKQKIFPVLNNHPHVLRPLNYPPGTVGRGSCIFETSGGYRIAVINLQGRSFMQPIDCPFRVADRIIQDLHTQGIRIILIDFHAEATAEKLALAYHLDGRITALLGTHTHVQTADERILPNGTACLTDAGMTGPSRSVIGMDISTAIQRFMTQVPVIYKIGEGNPVFCGAIVEADAISGRAQHIERLQIRG